MQCYHLTTIAMSGDDNIDTPTGSCRNRLSPDELFDEHLSTAKQRRSEVAEKMIGAFEGHPLNEGNEDEVTTVEYGGETVVPFGYQKGLGYQTAFGNREERYDEFIDAIEDDDQSEYPIGGTRPLVSPPSARSVATDGTDPWIGAMPPAPDHDSPGTFLEMLEVYLATHAREVPFAEYGDGLADHLDDAGLVDAFERDRGSIAAALPTDATTMDDWITAPGDGLFRDAFPGCRDGPYVSQHLVHDVPIGAQTLDIRMEPFTEGPFGETFEEHEEIVRSVRAGAEPGHDEGPVSVERGEKEYAHTGLDLASQVRDDPAYQPYLLATLQLFDWGVPYADDVPYTNNDSVLPYIDSGAVAVLDLLGRVTRNALLAAWHQKWYVHRRLRPETYAGRVEVALDEGFEDVLAPSSKTDLPPFTELNVMQRLSDGKDATALLPLSYPEGSPAHPAYPSGHSTIAGACATVLKTFFQNPTYDELTGVEATVSPNGEKRVPVDRPEELTVHGEINKLASNVGMGRIFAGVHYRTDHVYGMMLGEQIAVATLYDHFRPENADGPDVPVTEETEPARVPAAPIDTPEPLEFDPLAEGLVEDPEITPTAFAELREGTHDAGGNLPEPT